MSWVNLGVAAIGGATSIYGAYQSSKGGGGGGGGGFDFEIPPFWEDPFYGMTQEELFGFGSEGLKGKFNDYYGLIGAIGGPEFEDFITNVRGDIGKSVSERVASSGTARSPVAAAAEAEAVGSVVPKLRYQNYLDAISGRKFLLGSSLDTLSGVRSGALSQEGLRNQYELSKAKIMADLISGKSSALSSIASEGTASGIGNIGSVLALLKGLSKGGSGSSDEASGVSSSLSSQITESNPNALMKMLDIGNYYNAYSV